jgi:hypothetical protein
MLEPTDRPPRVGLSFQSRSTDRWVDGTYIQSTIHHRFGFDMDLPAASVPQKKNRMLRMKSRPRGVRRSPLKSNFGNAALRIQSPEGSRRFYHHRRLLGFDSSAGQQPAASSQGARRPGALLLQGLDSVPRACRQLTGMLAIQSGCCSRVHACRHASCGRPRVGCVCLNAPRRRSSRRDVIYGGGDVGGLCFLGDAPSTPAHRHATPHITNKHA